ncbi:hypothetical protein PHLGIDRAFT_110314 [Phlebiopsis gigantea 11061_1 CR5-6]|uniref:C2 domain-containing protein n=1 Tax=Phlebiopsis gigantea (strain 11061_1 CR5-6) TaxID=745531 RepID=A0A0C3RTD5_PHLG1|nr:hypothetical protein PHLGIDRAFT_110314 [Phlebiopsis gigantea 11061_1 CR5-6]
MDSSEPWYLTVVRTDGVLFLRPEKSWRPIVSLSLVETGHTHETTLGCDGQNPNMKNPLVLQDADHETNLDIKIWHKSATKKQRRKRHLVASAYVVLGELLKRQGRPNSDVVLNLKCPPPQKRSPALSSSRQANTATLIVRIRAPLPEAPSESSPSTLVSWPNSEAENLSEGAFSGASDIDHLPQDPREVLNEFGTGVIRRRRRKEKLKPYYLDSCEDDEGSYSESSCPPTPPYQQDYLSYSYDADADTTFDSSVFPIIEGMDDQCMPNILPQYAGEPSKAEEESQLSLVESFVDLFAPYREMSHPECEFNKVLARLLTEWYAIGASLLATAALNAAVFGYSSPSLIDIDSLALRSVVVGGIASGIGLVADVWFLVFYSGADVVKFQRRALDVYNTYLFFCLTCRLPTLCLFVSVCCLLAFLVAIAWRAWSTAVLVMCCAAGVLLTLQYLVYGCHRIVNFVVWIAWRAGHAVRGVFVRPTANAAVPVANTAAPRSYVA